MYSSVQDLMPRSFSAQQEVHGQAGHLMNNRRVR